MPKIIACDTPDVIDVEEFRDRFARMEKSPDDRQALESAAPLLKALSNNQQFFSDEIEAALDRALAGTLPANETGQVLPLGALDGQYFLRAVIWPAEKDEFYRKSGPDLFYYGKPHDHNFSFLTVGYSGPGYESHYFEFPNDVDPNSLHVGSTPELIDRGIDRLSLGKMMLYRASVDIHSQFCPTETSVSVNILSNPADVVFVDQRIFDAECTKVTALFQARANYGLFCSAVSMKVDDVFGKLGHISQRHPDPLIRYFALRAGSEQVEDLDARVDFLKLRRHELDEYPKGMLDAYLQALEGPAQVA